MATHTLVVIHGMGTQQTKYSAPFISMIKAQLGDQADLLAVHEVLWNDIGQADQDALLQKDILPNDYAMFDLSHPLLSLAESVDKIEHLSRDLRQFMINSVGDLLIYLTFHGKQQIQSRLKQAILQAYTDQPNASQPTVSVIAHSLGSVVLYDLARYFGSTPEGQAEIGAIQLANVFTMGSPLALFSLLEYQQPTHTDQASRSLNAPQIEQTQRSLLNDGQSQHRYSRPYSKRGIVLDTPNGRWLNFYDQQDPIAYKLHNFYQTDETTGVEPSPITDIAVQTGVLHAHSGYWTSTDVARAIAAQLKNSIDAPVA